MIAGKSPVHHCRSDEPELVPLRLGVTFAAPSEGGVCSESAASCGDACAAEKLEHAENQLAHSGRAAGFFMPSERKKDDSQLAKVAHDATNTTVDQLKDVVSQVRSLNLLVLYASLHAALLA